MRAAPVDPPWIIAAFIERSTTAYYECPVCLCDVTCDGLHTFSCQHAVCRDCFDLMVKHERSKGTGLEQTVTIKCPTCRSVASSVTAEVDLMFWGVSAAFVAVALGLFSLDASSSYTVHFLNAEDVVSPSLLTVQ